MHKICGRCYHGGRRGTGGPTYAVEDAENTRSTRYLVRLYTQLNISVHKASAGDQLSAASAGAVANQHLQSHVYRFINLKVIVGHT